MYRLVQGDVGAGKTLVAAISVLPLITANAQIAFMAPTELLAEQHFKNITAWFDPLEISSTLLLGKQTAKQKRERLKEIKSGTVTIIVGTHALFQKGVEFANLGLVIIDEQHRFGVKQRLELQKKGEQGSLKPHQLIMTATPIPRTLAMTQYASLDISVIDELPPGRKPINTVVIDNDKRPAVIERLRNAFNQKKQAYWVCPLIEESDVLECQAAEVICKTLTSELSKHKVGIVHGRMNAADKKTVMNDFMNEKLDLLVATTVIEVGVDVPNASLMIIENSERLGLSQLHQLRGRVGRGNTQSHCVLLFQSPLSETGRRRLEIMRQSNDGFFISEEDLKLRGSGDIIGTRQTGQKALKIANFQEHRDLIERIPLVAGVIESHPALCNKLIARWQGDGEKYVQS